MTSVTAGLKPPVNHASVKLDLHLIADRQLNDTFPTCAHLLAATMSPEKSRIEPTEEAPHADLTLLLIEPYQESDVTINVPNSDRLDGDELSDVSTNALKTDRLDGLEDIALYSNAGEPFFLVAGKCVSTRQQLELALSKQEKNRMSWVKQQCSVLPWLKYEKPAKKAVTKTESEIAEDNEREFQEDLKLIKLAVPTVEEVKSHLLTRFVNVDGTAKPASNSQRIEEIRIQLKKLRSLQQTIKIAAQPMAEQLYIRRQDTFDISRSSSRESLASKTTSRIHQKSQMRASSKRAQPITNSHPIQNNYGIASRGNKTGNLQLRENQSLQESPITNQIGDLLMQYSHSPQEKLQQNSGPISYLVTISPTANSRTCRVQPLPLPNSRSRTLQKSARRSSQGFCK